MIIQCLISYFIGAIPVGVILAKFFQMPDLQKTGSGNIGASNAFRVGGIKLGALTGFFDVLKGVIAYSLFKDTLDPGIGLLCVVIGNIYSIFLNFKGGKGVSAFLGWHLFSSGLGLVLFIVWVTMLKLFKVPFYSSLIMLVFSLLFLLSFWKFIAIILILYAHKANFQELFNQKRNLIMESDE